MKNKTKKWLALALAAALVFGTAAGHSVFAAEEDFAVETDSAEAESTEDAGTEDELSSDEADTAEITAAENDALGGDSAETDSTDASDADEAAEEVWDGSEEPSADEKVWDGSEEEAALEESSEEAVTEETIEEAAPEEVVEEESDKADLEESVEEETGEAASEEASKAEESADLLLSGEEAEVVEEETEEAKADTIVAKAGIPTGTIDSVGSVEVSEKTPFYENISDAEEAPVPTEEELAESSAASAEEFFASSEDGAALYTDEFTGMSIMEYEDGTAVSVVAGSEEVVEETGQADGTSTVSSSEAAAGLNAPIKFKGNRYEDSIEDVGEILRDGMKDRAALTTVYFWESGIKSTEEEKKARALEVSDLIFDEAVKHTGEPTEGDYLNWHWITHTEKIDFWTVSDSNRTYYSIPYSIGYYTDAAQEAEVDTAVKNIEDELALSKKETDYDIVEAIYGWICKNVTYNTMTEEKGIKFSAYGAAVNKSAVCQGYSLLFYRLALEQGIDCRLIAGRGYGDDTSNSNNHAWNIVSVGTKKTETIGADNTKTENVNKVYYNLDATWDHGNSTGSYKYFLLNNENFTSNKGNGVEHTRWGTVTVTIDNKEKSKTYPYDTEAFAAQYPISETNYAVGTDGTLISIAGAISDATIQNAAKNPIYWRYNATTGKISSVSRSYPIKVGGEELKKGKQYTLTAVNKYAKGKRIYIYRGVESEGYTGAIRVTYPLVKIKQTLSASISPATLRVGETAKLSVVAKGSDDKVSNYTFKEPKGIVSYSDPSSSAIAFDDKVMLISGRSAGTANITITADGDNYTEAASTTLTINVLPTKVTWPKSGYLTNMYNGVKLTWTKNTTGSGYYVYRNGTKVATIRKNTTYTYTDKKARTNGTKYTYTVAAYKTVNGKTYTGPVSDKKYTVFYSRPTAKVANTNPGKLKVSWGRNSKAKGYQVQYAYKSSFSGAKTVTIRTNKTISKVLSVKKGKTVYVRVRAYKSSTYSAWSKAKKKKITK